MLEQLAVNFKVFGEEQFEKIKSKLDSIRSKTKSPFSASVKTKGIEKLDKVKARLKSIRDKISKPFKMFLQTSKVQRALNLTKRGFNKFGNYATQQFEKAQKKANSFAGTIKRLIAALGVGLIIRTGISGAGNLEQYRNTLETVLKDKNKARKKLAWASRFANKTPFETGEVVGGMTKLESYGVEGDRVLKTTKRTYLEMIGDMAAGMGKSFDQAIEAVADARTGELERLKEFGMTKKMIEEYGANRGLELFNNKGQIKDMELFNKTLFEMMNAKFGGSMEKQANTFKGAWSTIKGAFKSGLSTLAGVNEFGDLVQNSPFQLLKDEIFLPFSKYLVKLQEDGTFTRWSEKLANGFLKAVSVGKKVINFIGKWKEVIIPLASALAGLFVINKIVVAIGALKKSLSLITGGFNPWMLAIGLVITAGIALYRNWDKITDKFRKLKKRFEPILSPIIKISKKLFFLFTPIGQLITIGKLLVNNWDLTKSKLSSLWDKIKNFGSFLWNFGKSLFKIFNPIYWVISLGKRLIDNWSVIKDKFSEIGAFLSKKLNGVWETLKNTTKTTFEFILDYISKVWDKTENFFSGLGSKIKSLPSYVIKFFKGDESEKDEPDNVPIDGSHKLGLARVPFDGYIAELHKNERILTAEENKNYSNTNISNKSKNTVENFGDVEKKTVTDNRKYELHIHVPSTSSGVDWNKICELIIDKLEEKELESQIARGEI